MFVVLNKKKMLSVSEKYAKKNSERVLFVTQSYWKRVTAGDEILCKEITPQETIYVHTYLTFYSNPDTQDMDS